MHDSCRLPIRVWNEAISVYIYSHFFTVMCAPSKSACFTCRLGRRQTLVIFHLFTALFLAIAATLDGLKGLADTLCNKSFKCTMGVYNAVSGMDWCRLYAGFNMSFAAYDLKVPDITMTIFTILGKFAVSGCTCTESVYIQEIYPTVLRWRTQCCKTNFQLWFLIVFYANNKTD